MRKSIFPMALVALFTLLSCQESENAIEGSSVSNAEVSIKEYESYTGEDDLDANGEGLQTRTNHLWQTTVVDGKNVHKMNTTFAPDDRIFIVPQGESTNIDSYNTYRLRTVGGNAAYFTSESFKIAKDKSYYCFAPGYGAAASIPNILSMDDIANIKLSYKGQRQLVNGVEGTMTGTDHLAAYDFLVGYAKAEMDNVISFGALRHLGSPMRIRLSFADISAIAAGSDITLTKFEIVTAEDHQFQNYRILDLTDYGSSLQDWSPSLTPSSDVEGITDNFTLYLGEKTNDAPLDPEKSAGITIKKDDLLVLYMMLPETSEYVGKTLYGVITDNHDTKYLVNLSSAMNVVPTAVINYGKKVKPSGTLSVSVSVNRKWQEGNTQSLDTRAGDPGIDGEELKKPRYIKIYTLAKTDGVYKFHNLTEINDIPETDWTTNGDKWVYTPSITINVEEKEEFKVYVEASYDDLEMSTTSFTKASTVESVIQDLTMTNMNTSPESVLMNTYSYWYAATKELPVVGAELYHVGAKLDVQWNSTSKLTGSVSVNNLQDNNIYVFQPTAQSNVDGTWSPSVTVNDGNCWNGRHVFYVPQKANKTYTVTVGTGNDHTPTFTAPATDSKTAWFKLNVQQ